MPRVRCIVTAISISLSLGWRQRGRRYAIRAGRNLPDKEFRSVCYLRHPPVADLRTDPVRAQAVSPFGPTLHVAMQFGLYLLRLAGRVGRQAESGV